MLSSLRLAATLGACACGLALVSVACSTTVTSNPFGNLDGGSADGKAGNGNGNGNGNGSGGGDLCKTFCDKAAAAKCSSQPTCEADCEKQINQVPAGCKETAEKLIECGGSSAGKINGCSASGKPKLEGCDSETTALLSCVQNPPGGGPDGGGGNMNCSEIGTGDATCDACLDANCCAQESACNDEPDCVPFFDCIAGGGSQANCTAQHPAGAPKAVAVSQCLQAQCNVQCP